MKTKISIAILLFASLFANAQMKVYSGGKISFGSTSTTPTYLIDLVGGTNNDVNTGAGNGYRIGGVSFLWDGNNPDNIYCGYAACNTSSTGVNNTYLGYTSAYINTTGYDNTFVGYRSGRYSTTGYYNTFIGLQAGYNNAGGYQNTFVGLSAGSGITSGYNNSFVGYNAGAQNTTGKWNTAVGGQAGYNYTTGDSDTYIGFGADGNAAYHNSAAFGYGATATGSRKMYFGNANVTGLYTTVGLFATSDGRFKTNVKEEVKGLAFIKLLRPITYNLDTKALDDFIHQGVQQPHDSLNQGNTAPGDFSASTNIIHSGFIAQEVEQASLTCGFKSSIVHAPDNSKDPYALSYAEIVVPLVKAVQELSKTVDSLKLVLNPSSGQRRTNSPTDTTLNIVLSNNSEIILYQNEPNPFDGSTVIRYFVPDNIRGSVYIGFYDIYGKEIKKIQIQERGFGKIDAATNDLAVGTYSYNITLNETVIDTKKMIKSK